MVTSYLLVEGMRVGACLQGLPLKLRKIERYPMAAATTAQPPIWTTVEFEFEDTDAELEQRSAFQNGGPASMRFRECAGGHVSNPIFRRHLQHLE